MMFQQHSLAFQPIYVDSWGVNSVLSRNVLKGFVKSMTELLFLYEYFILDLLQQVMESLFYFCKNLYYMHVSYIQNSTCI